MHQSRTIDLVTDAPLPAHLLFRLAPFADPFDTPTWADAPLLLTGTLLAPERRTVGREGEADYATYHRILARACRSSREVAGRLPHALVDGFVRPGAEVVIGLDDTIERRWGPTIEGRGIYRDPIRSSKGHFVEASGLRWLSAMPITSVPWAKPVVALPALVALLCRQFPRPEGTARRRPPDGPADLPVKPGQREIPAHIRSRMETAVTHVR